MGWFRKVPRAERQKCGWKYCSEPKLEGKSKYCHEHACSSVLPNGDRCAEWRGGFEYACAHHESVNAAGRSAESDADKICVEAWSDFAVTVGEFFVRGKVRPTAKEYLVVAARCRDAKATRYSEDEEGESYRAAFNRVVKVQLREHYLLMPDEIAALLAESGRYESSEGGEERDQ